MLATALGLRALTTRQCLGQDPGTPRRTHPSCPNRVAGQPRAPPPWFCRRCGRTARPGGTPSRGRLGTSAPDPVERSPGRGAVAWGCRASRPSPSRRGAAGPGGRPWGGRGRGDPRGGRRACRGRACCPRIPVGARECLRCLHLKNSDLQKGSISKTPTHPPNSRCTVE